MIQSQILGTVAGHRTFVAFIRSTLLLRLQSHPYSDHPFLVFNGIPVARKKSTKHLGLILDERLSFRLHIKEAIQKAKKCLGLLKYMSRHASSDVLQPWTKYIGQITKNCNFWFTTLKF